MSLSLIDSSINFKYLQGRHALVYDAGTQNEAWEWVNLREVSVRFFLSTFSLESF